MREESHNKGLTGGEYVAYLEERLALSEDEHVEHRERHAKVAEVEQEVVPVLRLEVVRARGEHHGHHQHVPAREVLRDAEQEVLAHDDVQHAQRERDLVEELRVARRVLLLPHKVAHARLLVARDELAPAGANAARLSQQRLLHAPQRRLLSLAALGGQVFSAVLSGHRAAPQRCVRCFYQLSIKQII